jgi:HK97 family phage prohead protease
MGEDGTEEEGTFTGYASVFNVTDSYGDIVVPGAFKRTLKNKKQFPILWSHSILEPVGVLTGVEDEKGLVVNGRLTKGVQKAQELRALMKDGAVNGLSIGYQVMKQEEDKEEDIRRLKEINLWEVSLCVFQACPGANVTAVKSMEPIEMKPYPNEHACRLREPGEFSEFRRTIRTHEGKKYSVIFGKDKDNDTWDEQAFRYSKDTWTVAEAKTHCSDHDGKFEAASGKGEEKAICVSCGQEISLSDGDPAKATPHNGDSNNRPSDPAEGHSLRVRATVEMLRTLHQELFDRRP